MNLLKALSVLSLAVLLTGCGHRLSWFGRGPAIDDGFSFSNNVPTLSIRDLDATNIGEPLLSDGRGRITPIGDKRWEGVAVYFAYDRYAIGASERPKIEKMADYLSKNPRYCLILEGHADERGSDEYNRGLSERRAIAVKEYLVNLGIDAARLDTLAYGEEKPAVPGAVDEDQHARNRRVEFVVGIRN